MTIVTNTSNRGMADKFKKLIFITSNPAKAKYLGDYFDVPFEHLNLDLPEIQSLDLRAIVEDKARRAFEIVKKPVLVEDIALTFNALGKLPGPLIKWFFTSLGNEGLCRLLDPHKDKSAVAEVQFALADEGGIEIFSGLREGSISERPKGEFNFGWDPIFIPDGFNKTWGEMTTHEKHETSIRKIALEKAKNYLINRAYES